MQSHGGTAGNFGISGGPLQFPPSLSLTVTFWFTWRLHHVGKGDLERGKLLVPNVKCRNSRVKYTII